MSRLLTFPGQGSQLPGMAKDWFENFSEARLVFEEASEASKLDLKKLCFDGTDEDLKATHITQPALLCVSVAVYRSIASIEELNPKKIIYAGHSLGEYSALVCAGALPLFDAARLVRRRGELMQEAVPSGVGAMAALVFKPGTDGETAALDLCKKAEAKCGKFVSVANFNSPEQIVISGYQEGVTAAEEIAKTETNLGIRKVVRLNVSAPFHCALMKSAAEKLAPDLKAAKWAKQTEHRYIPNTLATIVNLEDAANCALLLEQQITSSVRWTQSMKVALKLGIEEHLEVGAGSVLTGLIKRISASEKSDNSLKLRSSSTFETYKGQNS